MIQSLSNPSGEPSVQDALWHVALSDNSGQVDFKYVFDVYINGSQLIRSKHFANPSTGRGYFDAGPIVRNEFSYQWFVPNGVNPDNCYLAQPNDSGQISLRYDIRVGEDYSGVTTTNMASGTVQVFNWVPALFRRRQYDMTSMANKYMSDRPRVARHGLGEKLMIPIRCDAALKINCSAYDYNNNLIQSLSQSGTYANNGFVQLDIGSAGVNDTIGVEIVNENVKYYDVWFNSLEKFRVYLDCNPKYETVLLHFVNYWGMFETARFSLVRRLNMEVERKSFQKNDVRFGSGVTYYDSNNVYHETKTNYGSKATWYYKVTMDFPTDEEYQWIEQLIQSPLIYFQDGNDYYPVTLRTNNYEYSKQVFNGLKVLELEFDLNQTRYGYRR